MNDEDVYIEVDFDEAGEETKYADETKHSKYYSSQDSEKKAHKKKKKKKKDRKKERRRSSHDGEASS